MRIGSILVVSLFALALAACGGDHSAGGGGAAGTYKVDRDALKAGMVQMVKEQAGRDLTDEEMQMVDQQLVGMNMSITLAPDGVFNGEMKMGPKTSVAKGTWKLEGGRISITTTEEDGKAREKPDTKSADYRDGKIVIQEEDMPFPITLVRE